MGAKATLPMVALAALLAVAPSFRAFADMAKHSDEHEVPLTTTQQSQRMSLRDIGIEVMGDVHRRVLLDRGEVTTDPIALALHKCTVTNGDTVGITACLTDAYKDYDAVLNHAYTLAMRASDAETQNTLRQSQRQWIAFRDAEDAAHRTYSKTPRGTIVGIAIGYQKITAIRERIAELMFFLGADQG